jgi:hypothetical protein
MVLAAELDYIKLGNVDHDPPHLIGYLPPDAATTAKLADLG